ncbi:MAG: hypothetical protein ABJC13_06755 [Acidobacteriota bacterium]
MVPELRRAFNAQFSPERYARVCEVLDEAAGHHIPFRICETPLFLPAETARELAHASREILAQVTTPEYVAASARAVPQGSSVPGFAGPPVFIQFDFALVRAEDGRIVPRLIELQGFPSLYGFQALLARVYRQELNLPDGWTPFFGGLDETHYAELLRRVLIADGDPAETVLLEIDPESQKTRVDFVWTEKLTGVATVDVKDVIVRGDRAYYCDPRQGGRETPIRRIYNRAIFDEAERLGLDLPPVFRQPLDVEWLGHPDWFFRISKFSLPFLNSEYSPHCGFVSAFPEPPADLENYVLKPLRSFAGLGVELNVTRERLAQLEHPEDYILQKKVEYAAIVETPDVLARCEVRMMYLWLPEGPRLVNNLVRMTKGAMVGVDFNKDKTWVGASIGLHPPVE